MKRFSDFSIFQLIILISCVSCGIDEIPVLSKPQFGSNNGIDDYFEFKATENNGGSSEEEFRGFEVYYKFFSTDDGSTADYQSNYTSVNDLEAAGFRRITYYNNNDDCDKPSRFLKPLIKVPLSMKGTATTITINYGTAADKGPIHTISSNVEGYILLPEPTPTPLPVPEETPEPTIIPALPIRRGIVDDDEQNKGYYKGFETYQKTDEDVKDIASIDAKAVYILIYVLSYGIYNLSEPIYSDALCLGYIELSDLNVEE